MARAEAFSAACFMVDPKFFYEFGLSEKLERWRVEFVTSCFHGRLKSLTESTLSVD